MNPAGLEYNKNNARKTSRLPILFITVAVIWVLLQATSPVAADEVKLSSGDTIIGKTIELTDNYLVFEHEVLGILKIPYGKIVTVNGNPLNQEEKTAENDEQGEDTGQNTGEVNQNKPEEKQVNSPLDDIVEKKEWTSYFELAGNATFGNTDTQGFHIGFTTKRESTTDRTSIDASYTYGSSNGDRTTNKATSGVMQEWFAPKSHWFYFGSGRWDYDEFLSWEYRFSLHGGVGYRLINEEKFGLTFRGGAGATREFGSDQEEVRPEALLGTDIRWKITDRQNLTISSTAYPDVNDPNDFRIVSSADWSLLIDVEANLSLIAGLRHEYQSRVDPEIDHNDLHVFAGLKLDF